MAYDDIVKRLKGKKSEDAAEGEEPELPESKAPAPKKKGKPKSGGFKKALANARKKR